MSYMRRLTQDLISKYFRKLLIDNINHKHKYYPDDYLTTCHLSNSRILC